jgi:hypothetical protein
MSALGGLAWNAKNVAFDPKHHFIGWIAVPHNMARGLIFRTN